SCEIWRKAQKLKRRSQRKLAWVKNEALMRRNLMNAQILIQIAFQNVDGVAKVKVCGTCNARDLQDRTEPHVDGTWSYLCDRVEQRRDEERFVWARDETPQNLKIREEVVF